MQVQPNLSWRAALRAQMGRRAIAREREVKSKQRGKYKKSAKPAAQKEVQN